MSEKRQRKQVLAQCSLQGAASNELEKEQTGT
jgi:hypothetical protein